MVTLIGNPFSPYKSQNSTGYDLKTNPLSARLYFSILSVTFAFGSPTFARPETSPFISAKNTGTPISLKASASVFKVTVFPVPVAPAINP